MDNVKIAKYVQNIFHLENMTADDDSYNRGSINSNSWGDGITIRWFIRDFGDEKEVNLKYVYSMGSYSVSIDSGMTSKEVSKEIVELIGRVLITQADTVDPNTGMNNILSWPYNCNLAYVEYLIEALQYGDNEINSSRKPIKSSADNDRVYSYSFDYIITHDVPVEQVENTILRNVQGIKEIEVVGNPGINNTSWSKEEYGITSSMQGQERGIQAIMDEYGCSREEAIDIMNSEVTSGCHGKAKKKNKKEITSNKVEKLIDYVKDPKSTMKVIDYDDNSVTIEGLNPEKYGEFNGYETLNAFDSLWKGDMDMNDWVVTDVRPNIVKYTLKSSKQIKSSLKDEFDISFSNNSTEWPDDEYDVCLDNFKNEFAKDHNITYEEADKIYNELQDEWFKNSHNAGIPDIYSSTRRNIANLNRIFK